MKRFNLSLIFMISILSMNWAQLPNLSMPIDQMKDIVKKIAPVSINRVASFPGGKPAMIAFIKENLKYPEIGREYGLEGVIQVGFTVNTAGVLENLHIKQGLIEVFDKAVLEMIEKMPTWIPAMKNGQHIADEYEFSLRFLLQ
ncbi:MAG: energy transducer TonB [Saprospiraceae bacterium]|nr:energy transducer TonB [Saprospiraceae bacterium]